MLMNRIFEPADDQLIYHYCSAETLLNIVNSKNLRFSDINMLNDSQETRWGYSTFEEAATRLIERKSLPGIGVDFPTEFFDDVDKIMHGFQLAAHPFICCLSKVADSLEQWRAYGDDGRGFAIGFRAGSLKKFLPVTVLEVEYEKENQIKEMMAALAVIRMSSFKDKEKDPRRYFQDCVLLGVYMTALKTPAFHTEQEVRCVYAVSLGKLPDGSRYFRAEDDRFDTGTEVVRDVKFQLRGGHLCAYLDLPFDSKSDEQLIAHVIHGPKNPGNPFNTELLLNGAGLTKVKVDRSALSYR